MRQPRRARRTLAATLLIFATLPVSAATQETSPARPWQVCLSEAARRLAASPEPASTVADAVIGTCGDKEAPVRAHIHALVIEKYSHLPVPAEGKIGMIEAETRDRFDSLRGAMRGKMLAYVMELRAGR